MIFNANRLAIENEEISEEEIEEDLEQLVDEETKDKFKKVIEELKNLPKKSDTENQETEETALEFLSKIGVNQIPVVASTQSCNDVIKQEIVQLMDSLKVTNDIQQVEVFLENIVDCSIVNSEVKALLSFNEEKCLIGLVKKGKKVLLKKRFSARHEKMADENVPTCHQRFGTESSTAY